MGIAAIANDYFVRPLGSAVGKEKAETAEEAAAESETPDAEKEPEVDKTVLTEQISAFRTELFYKLINNETEIKIRIGSQEMSIKE